MKSILGNVPRTVPSFVLRNALIGIFLSISLMSMSACTSSPGTTARVRAADLSEEQKHRLYAAALAATEFPLENETFKEVCKKLEIFDAHGNQNENYMGFVTAHLEWAMKTETEAFKQEINTREKAREYVKKHLP